MRQELEQLIALSEYLGASPYLVQGGGGNCSVKIDESHMLIKASGSRLSEMRRKRGYVRMTMDPVREFFSAESGCTFTRTHESESLLFSLLRSSVRDEEVRPPSMEAAMHIFLPKYVAHFHSVHANVLNCMEEGEEVIHALFSDIPHACIPRVPPGLFLSCEIAKAPRVPLYFLKNHGVIVCSDEIEELLFLIDETTRRTKTYLESRGFDTSFEVTQDHEIAVPKKHFFPDSVVYTDANYLEYIHSNEQKRMAFHETMAAHRFIEQGIAALGKRPCFFSPEMAHYIASLESEKHRQRV